MFVELTEEAWVKFKPYLDKNEYSYKSCDVTTSKDSIKHIHVDLESVTTKEAVVLAKELDIIYGLVAEESKKSGEKERNNIVYDR